LGQIRIIGGQWKRTLIPVPERPGLRPTSDRIRETLFNWLGQTLLGCRCLDLFAGTGALGLEAASRHADDVVLVERDSTACSQLAHLIEKLKAQDRVHLVKADALAWARAAVSREGRAFNLIFLDPPFGEQLLDQALPAVLPLLAPSGQIYVESDQAISPAQAADWGLLIERKDKAGAVHYHLLRQDG